MVSEKGCWRAVDRLINSWTALVQKNRHMKIGDNTYTKYKESMNQLFDLALTKDEEELLNIMKASRLPTLKDDYGFYLNQKRGNRKVVQEGLDRNTTDRINRSILKKQSSEKSCMSQSSSSSTSELDTTADC